MSNLAVKAGIRTSFQEDLTIEHCTWSDMSNICILTPAMKHFRISNWDKEWVRRREDDGLQGRTLKVHAPNLEFFDYYGSIAEEYVLTTFP